MKVAPAQINPIVEEDLTAIVSAPLPWELLSGATVLVTGAAGFLPAYMVETLLFLNRTRLAKPARVIGLVRDAERARERFACYRHRSDLEIIQQDVSQPLSFSDPFEFVIHAASQASPAYYRSDPVGTLSPNVMGTYHLLTAAQRYALKGFLFFSSCAIYGTFKNGSAPLTEHDCGYIDLTDSRSCYVEAKRMGEAMCAAWAQQFNVPTRIVRPMHTYGPGMRLDDGRVFADFVRDILKGGPIVLKSDGNSSRCFCYLADATVGFFTVLLKGQTGESYNVANPDGECSIAGLADRLASMYSHEGLTVMRWEGSRPVEKRYFDSPILPNVDKLKALGWAISCTTIEEGFKRTVDSYRFAAAISVPAG